MLSTRDLHDIPYMSHIGIYVGISGGQHFSLSSSLSVVPPVELSDFGDGLLRGRDGWGERSTIPTVMSYHIISRE